MEATTFAVKQAQQPFEALRVANAVRVAKKEHKQEMHSRGKPGGAAYAAHMIRQGWAEAFRVGELLVAIPGVGQVRVNRMLLRELDGLSPNKKFRELTPRRRELIVELLERRAGLDA